MKPKYRRFAKTIPAIITLVMSSAAVSNAAILDGLPDGNVTITTLNDAGNAVNVSGGTDPSPFVLVEAGAFINGDIAQIGVINVSTVDYTITNNGTINSSFGDQGIRILAGSGGSVINNNGSIESTFIDAIEINTDGVTVNNMAGGVISGDSDGITAFDGLVVSNDGLIEGLNGNGISAGNGANITNSVNGEIYGENYGITAGGFATVTNAGLISGNSDYGVDGFDNLTVVNLAGGTITGTDGIDGADNLTVTNAGTITGTSADGIWAIDNALITNTGTIMGVDDGIELNNNGQVTNSGLISGNGIDGDGVVANDNSVVTNSGSIISTDANGVETAAAAATTFTLNNSGLVQGLTHSFLGSASDDTLNLNLGSRLVGDVNALTGIDTINFGEGISSPGGMGNSISGNVLGFTSINKVAGNGGVALIGLPGELFNVTADTINIDGGGLYINGNITAADGVSQSTINANGAALGGTGSWNADIFVTSGGFSAGAIPINLDANPANSVGTVTVNGNVDHDAGTFIRFDVIPGTVISNGVNSDLIVQTGALSFYDVDGANVRISPTSNNTPITAGTYTVVTSEGDITGTPGPLGIQFNDNVNAGDTGFVGTLTGLTGQNVTNALLVTDFSTLDIVFNGIGDDLILTIDRDFDTLDGLSGNSLSFASALDESLAEPELQDFIAALDYSTLADVQDIFEGITTLDSFSTAAAITSSNYHLHRVVQDHLAMARSAGMTIIETPATTDAKGGMIPAQTTTTDGGMWNVWGSFSYDWKDSGGFGNADIDGEEASFLAGIDYRIAPNFLLGILLEGSTADYDFSGGGSDVDSFRAAIYGTYGEATGFYADFLVGYGDHDFDSNRSSFLGSFDTDTDAESLQAMLTVGYAMQSGCVKHGPFGGIEYSKVDVDGYTQGGFLPLGIDDYDVESTRLLIGYRLEAEAGRFTPYASVAYAHELEDGNQSTTGVLPGGASFGIDGGNLDSAVLISVGTGYSINENLGLNVGYHGEISTGDGIDSHGATIGLNYAF